MKRLYRHLVVVAVYLLLTLVMTYPLGLRLGTHLLSSKNDFWIYPWNNWWIEKALVEGRDVYYSPYLFYPRGVELFWHGICWFNTFLWLPLQAVLGSLAAHNVTILLTYVVGAYTTYLLAYEVTGSRPAAFVAGLIYAFYPHRFSHRGQLKSLSNQWNPLFALFLVRLTRQGRLRDGFGAAVALTLSALCSWHQMLMTSVWGAMWVGWSLLAERRQWTRRTVLALVVGGVLCVVLLSPLLVPMVAALTRTSEVDLLPSASAAKEKSTDLLAYVLPNRDHSLFLLDDLGAGYDRCIHLKGPAAAVGWVTLLLAGWAVLKRWKAVLPWLLAALILAILALGPELQINGRVMSGFPLPYALIKPTIVGGFIRHPNRFNIVLPLPISVLAAVGLQAILERWNSRRRRTYGVTVCLAVLVLFEYSVVPVPTLRPPDSVFYRRLREEAGEFAVADFPIDLSEDKYYLFVQTLHERPIIGGHVSRPPADAHAFVESVPVLAAAREEPPAPDELADISRQLEPLADAGVRYVLVHKDRTEVEAVEGWRRWFGFCPAYEDDWVLAYHTEPAYGRDFELSRELYQGLGLVQATVSPGLDVSVLWGAAEPQHEDWLAELALVDETGRHIQDATFPLVDGWPTDEWPADALGRGRYGFQVDPRLPDGSYGLTLALVRADTGERVEESVVTIAALDIPWRLHALVRPPIQVKTDVAFGGALDLLGYDLGQGDDALTVTLHWQALRRMDESYKVFLHLYDVESGALAAQVDAVPRDWTYPTTSWVAGEVVSDELRLPLGEVPAGTYRLGVGVYGAGTGERLPVGGAEASSDVLILREITLP